MRGTIRAIEQSGVEAFLAEIHVVPAGRPISPFPGEAAVHTESRWEAAAIGDTDGKGSSGADGGEDSDGADFRGGFPTLQLWISPEEKRDAGAGSNPRSGIAFALLSGIEQRNVR